MDKKGITNLVLSGGIRPMAYKRQPESRWWIPVGVFLVLMAVMLIFGLNGVH